MFTGLVQAVGIVTELEEYVLTVDAPESWRQEDRLAVGESIGVNGCCLTTLREGELVFELSPETFARTAFESISKGSVVNLERAMRASDRFGGHIVQGHVDTVGKLLAASEKDGFWVYHFQLDPEFDRYLIDKGSIALDGISLTIVEPDQGQFSVWLIPHTMECTNMRALHPGDEVNVEFDVLAKHVEKLLAAKSGE